MNDSPRPKKKMGRPKKYDGDGDGAPYLGVRLDPPIYEHIKARPEGPRAYVQRLVTEDIERMNQVANDPALDDVPGQLLLNGASRSGNEREVTHE